MSDKHLTYFSFDLEETLNLSKMSCWLHLLAFATKCWVTVTEHQWRMTMNIYLAHGSVGSPRVSWSRLELARWLFHLYSVHFGEGDLFCSLGWQRPKRTSPGALGLFRPLVMPRPLTFHWPKQTRPNLKSRCREMQPTHGETAEGLLLNSHPPCWVSPLFLLPQRNFIFLSQWFFSLLLGFSNYHLWTTWVRTVQVHLSMNFFQ